MLRSTTSWTLNALRNLGSAGGGLPQQLRIAVFSSALIGLSSPSLWAEEPAKTAAERDRSVALAAAPIAGPEDVSRWIEELSHDSFTVRQAAAAHLLEAGMLSRQPLLAVADGPDPEKRAAAKRLIVLIDQSEFHRRLEAFAADVDGRQGLTLPGWEQYRKLIGSDPAARELFVDMQRQEGALIAAVFGGSKREPSDLLESRLARLWQWQNGVGPNRNATPPLGCSAALLFLGSVPETEVSENATSLIERLLQQPPIAIMLRSEDQQDPVRRLGVAWLIHCPTKSEEILQHRLNIICGAGLPEGLPLARAVVDGDAPYTRSQPATRACAALAVGQFGNTDDMSRLEPMLNEAANVFPLQQQLPGQNTSVQVRDAALIALLQLTNQRPADYGYLHARMMSPAKAYQLDSLMCEGDPQRAEPIAKWQRWKAAQKVAPKDKTK